jgi:hypothetical protein
VIALEQLDGDFSLEILSMRATAGVAQQLAASFGAGKLTSGTDVLFSVRMEEI